VVVPAGRETALAGEPLGVCRASFRALPAEMEVIIAFLASAVDPMTIDVALRAGWPDVWGTFECHSVGIAFDCDELAGGAVALEDDDESEERDHGYSC